MKLRIICRPPSVSTLSGMKLHALDGQRFVPHAHDDRRAVLVGRSRGDGEVGGKGILFHDQGVVARAGEGRGEPVKTPLPS